MRLSDIIRELKRQLDFLERQAQKAERYKKLKTELKGIELWQSSTAILEGQTKHEALHIELTEGEDKQQSLVSEISALEANIQKERSQTIEQEKELEQKQEEFKAFSDRVLNEENEIRELTFEIEQTKRSSEIKSDIFEQSISRLKVVQDEKNQTETKHNQVKAEFKTLDENFKFLEENHLAHKTSIEQRECSLNAARKSQLEVEQGLIHIEVGSEGLQEKIEEVRESILEHKDQKEEIEKGFKSLSKRHRELTQAYESEKQMKLEFLKDSGAMEERLENLKTSEEELLRGREEEQVLYSKNLSKLESLKELQDQFEGYQEGVRQLLLERKEKGIFEPGQPISNLIKIPEGYEQSLETCLGDGLQGLFGVSSLDEISTSMGVLASGERKSRVQFFVNDFINASVKEGEGVKNLSQFLEKPEPVMEKILSMFYLVEDFLEAKSVFESYHGFCITKKGQLISSLGQVFVGAQSTQSEGAGLLSRKKHIESLTKQVAQRKTALDAKDKQRQSLKKQIEQAELDLKDAKNKDNEQEFKIFELKKDLERSEFEKSKAQKELDKILNLLQESEEKRQGLEQKSKNLEEHSIELSSQKRDLGVEIQKLDEELSQFKSEYQGLQEEVTEKKVQHASLKSELGSLTEKLCALAKREEDLLAEIESLKQESESNRSFISSHNSKLSQRKALLEKDMEGRYDMERALSFMRDDFEKLTHSERKMSDRSGDLKIQCSKVESVVSETKIKLNQVQENLQATVDQVFEKYGVDLTTESYSYKEHLDLFDPSESKEVKLKAKDLKDKIARMGEVNVSAISEFDDIKTRYEFLSEQEKDLIKAKNQLERVIVRIDRICATRFRETFEAVNERFKRVFPVLFGGGEAKLILIESEEESGSESEERSESEKKSESEERSESRGKVRLSRG